MRCWHRLVRCPPARRGLTMLTALVLIAVAAPLLAPSGPWHVQPTARLLPPLSRSLADTGSAGTTLHLLGTDSVGRDILSRLIYGSRLSLTVGFMAMVLSGLFGCCVGVVSGYVGGIVESVAAWLIDVQLSFPFLLLAIFLLGALGGGTLAVVLILALATWVNYARVVRAQVLSIKHQGAHDAC